MNSEKTQQREELIKKRSKLGVDEVSRLSQAICARLYEYYEWAGLDKVHMYLPIVRNKEVDTWPIIETLWTEHPNAQISTSVYGESRSLRHVIINSETEFEEDSLGIPIPTSNFTQKDVRYDLIIVPVLGFDKNLNRLGYGRGVYDSFLTKQPATTKVGLAYEMSRLERIANETHDVTLDAIITEAKLYN